MMDRQYKYDLITDYVDRIVDGLDEPVDKGIKDTVIAMLANGFHTFMSCEGAHPRKYLPFGNVMRRSLPGPWISFGCPNLFVACPDMKVRRRKPTDDDVKHGLEICDRLQNLLNQFYTHHKPKCGVKLIIEKYPYDFRLVSLSASKMGWYGRTNKTVSLVI